MTRSTWVAANSALIGAPSLAPKEGRPLDPDRVEHRGQILHPLLERGYPLDRVREPRARLVKADHPGKAGQAVDRTLDRRELERRLHVGDEPWDEHEIKRSIADDGVG